MRGGSYLEQYAPAGFGVHRKRAPNQYASQAWETLVRPGEGSMVDGVPGWGGEIFVQAPFVILTGASGVGKTSIAQAIEDAHPEIAVYQGDRMGFPSDEILASYGPMDEPGGPLQRGFALYWLEMLAEEWRAGKTVLLETQCRIKFLQEALALHGIEGARIVLVECSDAVREPRLRERGHPELANEQMNNWSRYLHAEAVGFGHEVMDTTGVAVEVGVRRVLGYLGLREQELGVRA